MRQEMVLFIYCDGIFKHRLGLASRVMWYSAESEQVRYLTVSTEKLL